MKVTNTRLRNTQQFAAMIHSLDIKLLHYKTMEVAMEVISFFAAFSSIYFCHSLSISTSP